MAVTSGPAVKLKLLCWLFFYAPFSTALVLPEDRVDALYHSYDGGGVTVEGPSILVRKSIAKSVSISANHYVDSVSSASIDVVTQASAYTEERQQQSVSIDYLYDKSIMSYSYTTSVESDYDAVTQNININQEMFGGLTTVSLGYTIGDNAVRRVDDDIFKEKLKLTGYRISLSQVLTKNMLMSMVYEIISDEGFLNNPYRNVRFRTGDDNNPFDFEAELYPQTRTSNAAAIAFKYYLPYRAALSFGYRAFTDTWQISASTFDLAYTHPVGDDWLIEVDYRFYTQSKAIFYNDLFDFSGQFDFRARDKELSTYFYNSIGLAVSYAFANNNTSWLKKSSINLSYNYFVFEYDDFLDIRSSTLATLAEEPAYTFTAGVIRFYLSIWF